MQRILLRRFAASEEPLISNVSPYKMKETVLKHTLLSLYCILCGFFYLHIFKHSYETAALIFKDLELGLYKSIGLISVQLSIVAAALVPAIINAFVSGILIKFRNIFISLICASPIILINFYAQGSYFFQSIVSLFLLLFPFAISGIAGAALFKKFRSPVTYLNKHPLPVASSPFYFLFTIYVAIAIYIFAITQYGLFKGLNLKAVSVIIFSVLCLGALILLLKERISGWIIYNLLYVGSILVVCIYREVSFLSVLSNAAMQPSNSFMLIINSVCYFNRARLTSHPA